MEQLRRLYKKRFEDNRASKTEIWKILVRDFFQKFIPENAVVVDIAAGNCEFINAVTARKKFAFDLNPDIHQFADAEVTAFNVNFMQMGEYLPEPCDVIFASNIFEHLDKKEDVLSAMTTCREQLRMAEVVGGGWGNLLILQPNIKYVKGDYWDFIDHKCPLTDRALIEAGDLCGFKTVLNISRFLPYTTKSKIPQHPFLVWLYLRVPLMWRFLGTQSFLVMEKTDV